MSWDLDTLRREDMKMESAARGGGEINGEDIYKRGAYSFKSLKDKQSTEEERSITCYNCGTKSGTPIKRYKVNCPVRSAKCYNCQRVGHFSEFCKSIKNIRKGEEKIETDPYMKGIHERVYNFSLFSLTTQNILKNKN